MSEEPTPEEIARVRAFDARARKERLQQSLEDSRAKAQAHRERITNALVGQRILAVEVQDIDAHGDIAMRDGHLVLGLSSGQVLKISVGGWHEPYLSVEIRDSATERAT